MSRRDDLSPEDRRLWARITGTVTPARRRKAFLATDQAEVAPAPPAKRSGKAASPRPASATLTPVPTLARPRGAPEVLEPRRQRRLSRERDPIDARIDLHGLGRFQAQDALTAFLIGAQARGHGAVLVITGQGRRGGGVIRASVHEWLTAPLLRPVVSGFAPAARHHGGDGALYVTIRRA